MHPLVNELLTRGLWNERKQVRLDVLRECISQYAPEDLAKDFILTAAQIAEDIIHDLSDETRAVNAFVRQVVGDSGTLPAKRAAATPAKKEPLNFIEARKATIDVRRRIGPANHGDASIAA